MDAQNRHTHRRRHAKALFHQRIEADSSECCFGPGCGISSTIVVCSPYIGSKSVSATHLNGVIKLNDVIFCTILPHVNLGHILIVVGGFDAEFYLSIGLICSENT